MKRVPRLSKHSKERLVQRDDKVNSFAEAKKQATIAYRSGKTVGDFQRYPKFFSYLKNKNDQTKTCTLRIYHDNIYIWRGKSKTLITVHPIPDRYKEEMELMDKQEEGVVSEPDGTDDSNGPNEGTLDGSPNCL